MEKAKMTSQSLYNKTLDIYFESAKHEYKVKYKGEKKVMVPSVTTILGIIDKSGPLTWWASRMAVEYVGRHIEPGRPYDEIQLKQILEEAYRAHKTAGHQATSVGTIVHGFAEQWGYFKTGTKPQPRFPTNPEARQGCENFIAWTEKHKVKFLHMERMVYSRHDKFVGTVDLMAKIDGAFCVADYKTSKAVYPEYELQLAAYFNAGNEELAFCGKKNKIEMAYVLRFDKEQGIFEDFIVEQLDQNYKSFLAAKTLRLRIDAMIARNKSLEEAMKALERGAA